MFDLRCLDSLTLSEIKELAKDVLFPRYIANDRIAIITDLLSRHNKWQERLVIKAFYKRQSILDDRSSAPGLIVVDNPVILCRLDMNRNQGIAVNIVMDHLDKTQAGMCFYLPVIRVVHH